MSARSRRLLAFTSSSVMAAVGIVAAVPQASASSVACGAVITESIRLTTDLVCDGTTDALVIGADDIVVDLGGRTITGPGAYLGTGSGVRIANHSGVTIQRGTITGFQSGVVIDSGSDNTVNKIFALANDQG